MTATFVFLVMDDLFLSIQTENFQEHLKAELTDQSAKEKFLFVFEFWSIIRSNKAVTNIEYTALDVYAIKLLVDELLYGIYSSKW